MNMNMFDAIVIGARCAGSPTAMLLARRGYRVLLVDRATFPSDTISTHLIHPPGVTALKEWGLLDRLVATRCPPIHTYAFDMGPFTIAGSPGTASSPVSFAPRRTVLDKLLVDEAGNAGADIREGFTVESIEFEAGTAVGIRGHDKAGESVVERGRIVVGADGLHSLVARATNAEQYHDKPPLLAGYYAYWSGLDMQGRFEAYDRIDRSWAAWPTNDEQTLVIVGWPIAEFEANRQDVEGHYLRALDRAPAFAERIQGATRVSRFFGMSVPNFFRRPFGPGWALVGDAGYNRDFITAQGISDAFHDASLCATAIDEWLSGAQTFDVAMATYQRTRDARVTAMYEFTLEFARLAPPPPEMQQLMGAMHGNQDAMDGFARVISGVTSPAEFFSPENVGRIFASRL